MIFQTVQGAQRADCSLLGGTVPTFRTHRTEHLTSTHLANSHHIMNHFNWYNCETFYSLAVVVGYTLYYCRLHTACSNITDCSLSTLYYCMLHTACSNITDCSLSTLYYCRLHTACSNITDCSLSTLYYCRLHTTCSNITDCSLSTLYYCRLHTACSNITDCSLSTLYYCRLHTSQYLFVKTH